MISAALGSLILIGILFIDWYVKESIFEHRIKQNEVDYVPEVTKAIKTNDDGTRDYSELVSDFLEELKEEKRKKVEESTIEGTEAEKLLSSLQKELGEKEPILGGVVDEPMVNISEDNVSEQDFSTNDHIDTQERIYELREKLSQFSYEDAELVDIEEIISAQYELFKLEGRDLELEQLQEHYPMYFPSNNIPSKKQKIYDEDILTLDDMNANDREIAYGNSHKLSTARVSDNVMGEQKWRGRVFGKSDDYIHFNDGSRRIWLKIGKKVDSIQVGDEILLNVNRTEEKVFVNQLVRIKLKVSEQKVVNN